MSNQLQSTIIAFRIMQIRSINGGCKMEHPDDMGPLARGVHFGLYYYKKKARFCKKTFNKNLN